MSAASPVGSPARDPGLQGERTALAWNRTGLSLGVNALLALRTGWVSGHGVLTVVGVLLLLSAAAVVIHGNRRGRLLSAHDSHLPSLAASPLSIALTAVTTLAACAAGAASVLVLH